MGRQRTGSSVMEYAVLIAVLSAALLTMQIYMKRGFSGRLRAAADSMGAAYAPKRTTSDLTMGVTSTTLTTATLTLVPDRDGDGVEDQAMITTTKIESETTSRTGEETVGSLDNEKLWE